MDNLSIDVKDRFEHWKKWIGRNYTSPEEESIRFKKYKENWQKIEKRNALNEAKSSDLRLGSGPFTDLSYDEFKDKILLKSIVENNIRSNTQSKPTSLKKS